MDIKPFKGIFYNQSKVVLEDVVTPPYDVISSAQQEEYYKASKYNAVRLDLNKEEVSDDKKNNRYTRSAALFKKWMNENILLEDDGQSFFLYEQIFESGGKEYNRQGLIALVRIYDFESGKILPHERTLPKAQEDRFNLIKAAQANFSSIFGLYADKNKNVEKILKNCSFNLLAEVRFQDVLNRLSAVNKPNDIRAIQEALKSHLIYIADGHHRYKISLMYRDLMRAKNLQSSPDSPWEFAMMNLVNTYSEGLVILSTHRVVKLPFSFGETVDLLSERFELAEKSSLGELFAELSSQNGNKVLGMYMYGKYFLLTLTDDSLLNDIPSAGIETVRNLDVILLHEAAFYKCLGISMDAPEKGLIKFIVKPDEAVAMVDERKYDAVFFLNPTKIEQVQAVAEQGEIMPQKSTYFYPKLLTGLIMRKI